MKKLSLVLTLVFFVVGFAMAQRTIEGTVNDESGTPLIGASILVKGTSRGTVTDIDGNYTLEVPEDAQTLVVSYTGYATKEIEIGASNVINVSLESSAEELTEVVVTGLGIERERKALGYGVTTLDAAETIAGRQETDVARLLRGRAPGVDITQTSGMVGSGTNVIIRGYSSITGTNQPLFVVDGAPLNTGTNNDENFAQGGAMASSRFLDLDPNNIKEISVLRGLSATVLYGEAGRNGVILITTKTGAGTDADKGLEVSLTQNVSVTQVANLPDYQNTFGNGFSGNFGWFFSNWGPAFDVAGSNGIAEDGTIEHPYNQEQYADDFPEFQGVRVPYEPHESVENFFQNGLTSNTSLTMSNNLGQNGSITATYSYLNDEGFTPELDELRGGGPSNQLEKHNFSLGANTRLSNGLGLKGTFNYINSTRRIPPTSPSFGGTAFDGAQSLYDAVMYTPRSIDLMNLPYQSPIDGSNVYYRRGGPIQNPRWTLNNVSDNEEIQRFFGIVELDYQITPWLSAMYRLSIDQYSQAQSFRANRGGSEVPLGEMESSNRQNRLTDQVANLNYNFQLGDDFTLDGIVGANFRKEVRRSTFLNSENQFIYNLFTHDNYINHNNETFNRDENTLGFYGTATLGYRSFLYLNLQGRNDWTSTLEPDNRSQFYPSASVSFVPTDAFMQTTDLFNYLKLRVGVGTSAGYPNPYRTRNFLAAQTRAFITNGGTILNTNAISQRLGNPNLEPELHTEVELGIESRFLNNRVGVDLSLYNKNSEDLIIDLDLDPATGATETTVNAADLNNKGIELGLNIVPVRNQNFNWNINLNYTRNRSEVQQIFPGVDQVGIAGYSNLGNFALVGEQYGIMQGLPFVRDDDGNLVVNSIGEYQEASSIGVIGDPNPDFTANWVNDISWKNFSFGFQWQYRKGGDIYSSTIASLMARGNTTDTDVDRFQPIILPGVRNDGTPNDIQTYMGDSFFSAYFSDEGGVFDGTFIRLRSASLGYNVPQSVLEGTPFGRLSIQLTGDNLWFRAPNTPEGINFDPEVLSLGVGNGRGFDFRTGPTGRRYGVSVNVTF